MDYMIKKLKELDKMELINRNAKEHNILINE